MNSPQVFINNISDEKLFMLCQKYGARARMWRQKFIGLLPEVHRRKLYEKKGFGSIFEFAAKLCGLSEEQVRRVLNLEKKLEQTPILHTLLVNGEVSTNKLLRITAIATQENEEFLATQVQLLPKSALETLVRDEKKATALLSNDGQKQQLNLDEVGFHEPKEEVKSVPGHGVPCTADTLHLSKEVENKLLELQQKGININELLLEFLEKREQEITEEKEQITKEMSVNINKKPSRYIPKKVQNILKKEHGDKCSIPTCYKKSEQNHHTQRFSIISKIAPERANSPKYLAPLCKDHHQIAHSIDIKYHEVRQKVLPAVLQSRPHYSY